MKKIINFRASNFYPKIKIDHNSLNHQYYRVRHPSGIFYSCSHGLLSSLRSLILKLNDLEACYLESKEIDGKSNLPDLTTVVLWNLNKFFESGYEIFLAFCEEGKIPAEKEFLHQWFCRNGINVKDYFNNLKAEKRYYSEFYNNLKHSSNRIRNFGFCNEDRLLWGFYLEGASNDSGAIGPIERFHTDFKGLKVARSYNLFINEIYYLFYKISDEIGKATCNLLGLGIIDGNQALSCSEMVKNENLKKFVEIHELICENQENDILFPNEVDEVWRVDSGRKDEVLFVKEKSSRVVNENEYSKLRPIWGDGYSCSFSLPYK